MDETFYAGKQMQPNLHDLATTIALASDALAAAAGALAEASRAISDASDKLNKSKDPVPSNPIIELAEIRERSDLVDTSTNNKNQHVISISSECDSEVEVTSDHFPPHEQVPEPSFFQPETTNNLRGPYTTTVNEINDQLDPSFAPPNPTSSYTSTLLDAMNLYPRIPSGRNYIYFDQDSDGLAFVAYMALQANRIVCLIPDDIVDGFSKLLKSLTHANVHRADTPEQFTHILADIGPLNTNYYDIFCTSRSKFILNAPTFLLLCPDYILHWGLPSSSYYYIALAKLPQTVRNCIMEIGEYQFDESAHGAQPYSKAILDACFHPDSPFEPLRKIAFQLVTRYSHLGLT
ncbi:hypothetical protein RHS04_00418 [Rhizoctonia solani]|uniref:Uncharacterized protein n=1 Tax=Rhizoctonia solani TaxID=456999 RepID=A0A8H7LL86_9AGAM|nr:hypothetical protein RHS04_00418 [Rhizoctonia solani]